MGFFSRIYSAQQKQGCVEFRFPFAINVQQELFCVTIIVYRTEVQACHDFEIFSQLFHVNDRMTYNVVGRIGSYCTYILAALFLCIYSFEISQKTEVDTGLDGRQDQGRM